MIWRHLSDPQVSNPNDWLDAQHAASDGLDTRQSHFVWTAADTTDGVVVPSLLQDNFSIQPNVTVRLMTSGPVLHDCACSVATEWFRLPQPSSGFAASLLDYYFQHFTHLFLLGLADLAMDRLLRLASRGGV